MNPEIVLVAGPCANACAAALAGADATAVAADHLRGFGGFEATRPVFIHAAEERNLANFKRKAAAVLWAPNGSNATVVRGHFRGAYRGQSIRWGAR